MANSLASRQRSSRQSIPSTTPAPARSAPVQRRGIERVKAILDAAEVLLGSQGYEAATLKAIGERASIPTASVYHYFADRHAVDVELMQRHVREANERVSAALANPALRTLRDAIDAAIDPLLGYFRQHPSLIELWFTGRYRNPTLNEMGQAYDDSQAEQLWRFLIERNLIRADTPQLVVQLAYEASARLFDVAFRRSPTGDDTTIDEARRLVTAYLETYAPQVNG
jgi:AcrR family transcriptional regulator